MLFFAVADAPRPLDLESPISQIVWGAGHWFWPAIVTGLVLMLATVWSYGGWPRENAHRIALFLKLLAIGLLLICILDPLRQGTRARPQANLVPLLVDRSQSMTMRSSESGPSRLEQLEQLLDEEQSWRVRLAQDFDVRAYQFASRLEPLRDMDANALPGSSSALATSLSTLKDRLSGRPIAGVLVFSDGNLTDQAQVMSDWTQLGFPVYPVIPDEGQAPGDLRVEDVSVRQSDFETSPVTIHAVIVKKSLSDSDVIVRLEDAATSTQILEQTVSLESSNDRKTVTLKFRPEKPGVGHYRLLVFRESDRENVLKSAEVTTSAASEATFQNNVQWLSIDRGRGPHRILYVSGRPNWDFKFIRRAVQSDPEVKLVGLLRIANKEAKFSFRDQSVAGTNPLFAGLGDDAEEAAQQYDEPVMLRLGVEVSDELSDGFPRLQEELFDYKAVILDDIEPDFFTPDQLLMLRRFVAFRGGGLLMMGGQESFDSNRFAQTPLGELSPVYTTQNIDDSTSDGLRFELTREGLLEPWLRMKETESAELQRLRAMPSFNTANRVGAPKPGAIVLGTLTESQGQRVPAFVVQRFGKGKSAAMPLGDTWKWAMRRSSQNDDEPARWWRQVSRWLVNDVPSRATTTVNASSGGTDQVTIRTEVKDEAFLPLDNARVQLDVIPISGSEKSNPISLTAQPSDSEVGVYESQYYAANPGAYLIKARVMAEDGSEITETETGWATQVGQTEFRQWELNRDFLQTLAAQTGGQIVEESEIDGFVETLNRRKVPVEELWTYPLWHQPSVMVIALLCLCSEWGLRRWKGFP